MINAPRSFLGLLQKAFGELVGVGTVYINYLEKRGRSPSKTLCILLSCIDKKEHKKKKKKGVPKHDKGNL